MTCNLGAALSAEEEELNIFLLAIASLSQRLVDQKETNHNKKTSLRNAELMTGPNWTQHQLAQPNVHPTQQAAANALLF